MTRDRGRIALIACDSGKHLMKRLHEAFGELCRQRTSLSEPNDYHVIPTREIHFSNQEVKTEILENIRGDDVYILQCMDDPLSDRSVNDNFMALISAIDAAFQSDAESITAVIPQFPYARQERRKSREGITARLVARFLETAGANRVITLDVHAQAIAGFFFEAKFENLHASRVIIDDFTRNFSPEDLIVVAPDVGSAERARFYSKNIATMPIDLAILDKVRDYGHKSAVSSMRLVGDVEGKDVFMGDDMIATGGTLIAACRELKERGARDIYLACSLPFFNGNAVEKFSAAYEEGLFKTIIGTDAVFRGLEFQNRHPWYREVSIAPLFAEVIYNINHKLSVSSLLR